MYEKNKMEEANRFLNEKQYERAIVEYKKVISSEEPDNIKYDACLKLFHAYEDSGNRENGMYYLVRSYNYDKTRVEGIYNLVVHYCCEGQHEIAHHYYSFVKDWYEVNYQKDFSGHPDQYIYDFFLPYYMIISSQRIGRLDTASFVSKVIFTKKHKNVNSWFVRNLVHNIQFVVNHVDKKLLQSYITFLVDSGYDISSVGSVRVLENHGIVFNIPPKFSQDECRRSKSILFYTGFANPWWNYTYSIKNALGGSETAVAYLSQCFPKDYTVYVTGEVHEEEVGNVKYVNIRKIQELCDKVPFHTVIISRYIAFFEMFKFWTYQTFVWGHDTSLMPYGCNLSVQQIIDKWHSKIDKVICLTEWHKNLYTEYYPQLADKIVIINNGIKDDLFNVEVPKVPNSFVYTSCSNRGLKRLLELWSQILEKIPDATLHLASYVQFPNTDEDHVMDEYIQKTPSIKHYGKLGSRELYQLISSSEYWLYPTCWCETSCITALEMLRCGVICIYYPVAGLPYTLGNNGFSVKCGEEVDTILRLTPEEKERQIRNGKEYVKKCSWKERFNEYWDQLIFGVCGVPIKVVNMERRKDRKAEMVEKLSNAGIHHYEFIKACDGKQLEPSQLNYELFKGNDFYYSMGVMGCALSHINIWKSLVDDKFNDAYIVFEDDIMFSEGIVNKLKKCYREFKQQNMEYLMLGAYSIIELPVTDDFKINLFKMNSDTISEGTFAYIIRKTAAKKLLTYFTRNRIKYAVDKPLFFYDSGVVTHLVSEPIIKALCKQLCGENVDTDIQHHIFRLKFPDHVKNFTDGDSIVKQYLTPNDERTVGFCDWWNQEYGGGTFNPEDNLLINTLRKHSSHKFRIVSPDKLPDILFYSVFGNNNSKINALRKIFYTGEPYSLKDDADYNVTFDDDSAKNTRVPLWLCYMKGVPNTRSVPENKRKFCSFVASNEGRDNIRKRLVESLSKYKKVDCGGQYMNNIGMVIPKGTDASGKINFNKQYKFTFAIENTNTYRGYCTEKILDAFKSGCVPIYWGHPNVVDDFDMRSFINANDFASFEELTEYVRKVDNDDVLYRSYFEHPIFSEYWLNVFNDPNQTFFKNLAKNILGE